MIDINETPKDGDQGRPIPNDVHSLAVVAALLLEALSGMKASFSLASGVIPRISALVRALENCNAEDLEGALPLLLTHVPGHRAGSLIQVCDFVEYDVVCPLNAWIEQIRDAATEGMDIIDPLGLIK